MTAFTSRGIVLIVLTSILSAGGITLMKAGISHAAWLTLLLPGIVVYGISVLFGLMLIGRYPISVAYPALAGLSLTSLAVISAVALGEPLTPLKLLGTGLIVTGVALLVRPAAPAAPVPPAVRGAAAP